MKKAHMVVLIFCLVLVGCSRYSIEDAIDYDEGTISLRSYAWHYEFLEVDIIADTYLHGVSVDDTETAKNFFIQAHAILSKEIDTHKLKLKKLKKLKKHMRIITKR